jgi:hypothetical protein
MWYGDIAAIPGGWALCNGENGTPNLLDKFVIGAGSAYTIGQVGGYLDACLPSHDHAGGSFTGTTNVGVAALSDPGHVHLTYGSNGGGGNGGGDLNSSTGLVFPTSSAVTGITDTGHTHTVSGAVALTAQGEDPAGRNLPPFVALAYIMKIA